MSGDDALTGSYFAQLAIAGSAILQIVCLPILTSLLIWIRLHLYGAAKTRKC